MGEHWSRKFPEDGPVASARNFSSADFIDTNWHKGSLGSRYKAWRQAKENWQHFSSSIGSCFSDPFGSFAQDSRTAFELSMLLDKQLNSPYSALRRGPLGTG